MASFVVIRMGFKAFWRATNTRGARRRNFTNAHWDNSLDQNLGSAIAHVARADQFMPDALDFCP
jgi:hypothetical protein